VADISTLPTQMRRKTVAMQLPAGVHRVPWSSAIFRFDLDEDCIPYNKKLIDLFRSYADGLHIDDYGRIWTAEYDGIVVRKRRGKILGVFNAYALLDGTTAPMTNFALAGDKLIIQAVNKLYVMHLGQNVTRGARATLP
jgi:gluconolactonase